jgi:nucleoside-diphosphate-sugar epimerase
VLIKQVLGWALSISLRDGLEMTYRWIYDQVKARAEERPFIAAYE